MGEIEFTQYLRPNGQPRTVRIVRSADVCEQAEELRSRGVVFAAEVLTTGDVSFTAETPEGRCIAIEVVPNGPGVPKAVDRLIDTAWVVQVDTEFTG